MGSYGQAQWVLLFFIYSFCGWIWECCYVSVRKRQWVNRGFLHGPWIPLYGSGAILVLFLTLPVREHLALVFLVGMAGATVLEYVTGAVMERLFQMRYWDYSKDPLNVNGYICLPVSLVWGGFSVLLTEVLHPPVERLVLAVPQAAADGIGLVLTVLFTVDVTRTVQAALDLRALLVSLSASSQGLSAIEQRLRETFDQLNQGQELFKQKMRQLEEEAAINRDWHQAERAKRRELRNEFFAARLADWRNRKSQRLAAFQERSEAGLELIRKRLAEAVPEPERIQLEEIREKLVRVQESIRQARADMESRRDRDFRQAMNILSRNPSAASRRYGDVLKELASLRQDSRAAKKEKGKPDHAGPHQQKP